MKYLDVKLYNFKTNAVKRIKSFFSNESGMEPLIIAIIAVAGVALAIVVITAINKFTTDTIGDLNNQSVPYAK